MYSLTSLNIFYMFVVKKLKLCLNLTSFIVVISVISVIVFMQVIIIALDLLLHFFNTFRAWMFLPCHAEVS